MTLDDSTETGPLYNVPLLKTLPLGTGAMLQAMPLRFELAEVAKTHPRVVAGYEVLLAHYRRQCEVIGSVTEVREIIEPKPAKVSNPGGWGSTLRHE